MKYSKIFSKTQKESKEYDSKNASLLIKGGFIDQVMSGVYSYLPLGLRVLNKIEDIVRSEMDLIGHEVVLPALSPRSNWETTGRLGIDVLLAAKGANEASINQNDADYILNPTHEDIITPTVMKFVQGYKELPVSVYQIQNKFRNEARPKGGLLRGREFRMKDLYSFHDSKEDFEQYYEKSKESYTNVYKKLGMGEQTVIALASGGDFTENYSHEFQTFCDIGEDTLFHDESEDIYYNREVAPAIAPRIEQDSEQKSREDVFGEGIVTVEKLVEFLGVEIESTVKTILYKADDSYVAVAIRGDYEVDEGKVKKQLRCEKLEQLSDSEIKELTNAEVGYAGIVDLPEKFSFIADEALENMVNFEVGINKTGYHAVNANWDRDVVKPESFFDLKVAKEGDINPKTNQPYQTYKTAEVGNIFPLETKFPDAFGFTVMGKDGKPVKPYMGSYGIGTTRIMGVIAETNNDENGLIWPKQIAPFQIHLVSIARKDSDESYTKAAELYKSLSDEYEVLWDDRIKVRPGEKFADADLIGVPVRVVISGRSLEAGGFEVKLRTESESRVMSESELTNFLSEFYN